GVKTHPAEHYLAVIWNHGAGWDDSNLYSGDYFSGDAPPIVHKGQMLDARGSVAKAGAARGKRAKEAPIPLAQGRAAVRNAQRALFATSVRQMVQDRAIAFDDQAKDYLDNAELKRVLTNVKKLIKRKIDIIGFDACLMSMLEVGYEIKGTADFTVGSQEEEPNNGWPYDRLLKALAAKPDMSPADLARACVSSYLDSYRSTDDVTFSAVDLTQIDIVADAANTLGGALSKALGDASARAALASVRARVQEYSAPYDDYVDLVDLCDGLTSVLGRAEVTAACGAVKAAVGKTVLASGAKGAKEARSHGTSIYFPKKQVCRLYASLDFARKSAWAKFIQDYCAGPKSKPWS
ncbi:MAG TPA: clostripain-related cysteine peptidase, partial [Thiobacillaceae bacterium]|nr:clostripain-related cysteine peptidase [Thiobacillaceae bacterium]